MTESDRVNFQHKLTILKFKITKLYKIDSNQKQLRKIIYYFDSLQVAQLSQKPRCKVRQFWPKAEDWNWETIFTDIIGLSSTTVT